jgi:ComF family protein
LAWLAYALHRDEHGPDPELIAPTPLHPRRLAQRGYNQSLELSRALSRRIGAPLESQAMRRTRRTRPQHSLNREERIKNVANALLADPRLVKGKRVLLVDDIMTSGATLREATRALFAAGAAQVSALVVARASGRD